MNTIKIDPESINSLGRVVKSAIRDALQENSPGRARPGLPMVICEGGSVASAQCDPIKIQSPDGQRFMFVDEAGESHWVRPVGFDPARAHGWRQCYVRRAS